MIPLYKPYMPQLPELEKVLNSGNLAYGEWTKKFEGLLQNFINEKYLIVTNTYISAINIALTVLNLKPGDEVIASPMSCLMSNMPLLTFGLKIKWADIDPQTGTLDPKNVRSQITANTKLIFHNHFCGYMGYIDEINAIGKEKGIPVIDDCIEAFGSKYKNNVAGNLGTDISVFSFQTVRLPNSIDGGAVVFKNKDLYEKSLLARDCGIDRSIFRDKEGEISPLCDISHPGYAATMSNVNGYIGYKQMFDIELLLLQQQKNALFWNNWLVENIPQSYLMNKRKEIVPNYWVYGFLTESKNEVMLQLRKRGFYASGVHLNNNSYSAFGKHIRLCGVEEFNKKFLAVPSGWWINNE